MNNTARKAGAFDGKHFLVCAKRCDQCLFSSNKIVNEQRKDQLLTDCAKTGRYFICHKSKAKTPVVCRGFFDSVKNVACQVYARLGLVLLVNPEKIMEKVAKKLTPKKNQWYVRKRDKVVVRVDVVAANVGKFDYVTMPMLMVYTSNIASFAKNFRAATAEEVAEYKRDLA